MASETKSVSRTEVYALFLLTWVILVGSVAGSDALTTLSLKNTLLRLEKVVKTLEGRREKDRDPRHRIGEEDSSIGEAK